MPRFPRAIAWTFAISAILFTTLAQPAKAAQLNRQFNILTDCPPGQSSCLLTFGTDFFIDPPQRGRTRVQIDVDADGAPEQLLLNFFLVDEQRFMYFSNLNVVVARNGLLHQPPNNLRDVTYFAEYPFEFPNGYFVTPLMHADIRGLDRDVISKLNINVNWEIGIAPIPAPNTLSLFIGGIILITSLYHIAAKK